MKENVVSCFVGPCGKFENYLNYFVYSLDIIHSSVVTYCMLCEERQQSAQTLGVDTPVLSKIESS